MGFLMGAGGPMMVNSSPVMISLIVGSPSTTPGAKEPSQPFQVFTACWPSHAEAEAKLFVTLLDFHFTSLGAPHFISFMWKRNHWFSSRYSTLPSLTDVCAWRSASHCSIRGSLAKKIPLLPSESDSGRSLLRRKLTV